MLTLKNDGDPQTVVDHARRLVFLKGNDSHDYKFSSAALEGLPNAYASMAESFLGCFSVPIAKFYRVDSADCREDQQSPELRCSHRTVGLHRDFFPKLFHLLNACGVDSVSCFCLPLRFIGDVRRRGGVPLLESLLLG